MVTLRGTGVGLCLAGGGYAQGWFDYCLVGFEGFGACWFGVVVAWDGGSERLV